jgi:hypothetical protein
MQKLKHSNYKMEIQRVYEKTLNLSAVDMLNANLDSLIFDILKEKYENRCENFTFIKKIKSIIKRSMVTLNKDQLDGSGTVNIQFLADSIIYEENSIMVGCKIIEIIRSNLITCKYANTLVCIRADPSLSTLKKDDKIIVRVLRAGYAKDQKTVSIYGQMYFCPREFIIFLITPPTEKYKKVITQTLLNIDGQLAVRDKLNKTQKTKWDYFANLFYPFKQKPEESSAFKKIDMITVAKSIVSGKVPKYQYLTRHPAQIKSEPFIHSITEESIVSALKKQNVPDMFDKSKMGELQIIKKDLFSAINEYLFDYLSYIKMLNELAQYTIEEFNAHKHVWAIYEYVKK